MKKGFTLIEMLVVLVVIGVIVGLILPNTLKAIEEANERECTSNIRSINTACQLCYTTTRDATQCAAIAGVLVPAYMDNAPTCPFGVAYALLGGGTPDDVTSVATAGHWANWPPQGGDNHL